MNNLLKIVLLAVLVAIIAIAVILLWPSGSAQAQGPGPANMGEDEAVAAGFQPLRWSQPVGCRQHTGSVTHDPEGYLSATATTTMMIKGGWGRGRVLGYHVKSDGPHELGLAIWLGTTTTISYGQVATACIEQKVKPYWNQSATWTWNIVSPEKAR